MANDGYFNTGFYGDRCAQFTWNIATQSVDGNYTIINWWWKGAGGGTSNWYYSASSHIYINGVEVGSSGGQNLYNGTQLASGQTRIDHDENGNASFSANGTIAIYNYAENLSGNGTWSLPTIARGAKIISAIGDLNDEEVPWISFSNPANASMYCWIEPNPIGEHIAIRTISGTSGIYRIELTEDERNQIRAKCTSNSCTIRIGLHSEIGGTAFDSYVDRTWSIINANPTVSAISYKDSNTGIVNVTKDDQLLVKTCSNLQVTIPTAQSYKCASIVKYEIKIGNDSDVYTTAGIKNIGIAKWETNQTILLTVTDSRGNTCTTTKDFYVYNYSAPTITATANRVNNYEDNTNIKANITYSNASWNEYSIYYRIALVGGSFGDITKISNNTSKTIILDKSNAYDINFYVEDLFNRISITIRVNRGYPIIFFDTNKLAVSVNTFPSGDNKLTVNGNTEIQGDLTVTGKVKGVWETIYPIGSIYLTVLNTSPADLFGGTWELIEGGRYLMSTNINAEDIGGQWNTTAVSLTVDQMPKHSHAIYAKRSWDEVAGYGLTQAVGYQDRVMINANGTGDSAWSSESGGGQPHMHYIEPPYYTVRAWKRTA